MSLRCVVLGFLSIRPMTGYDLKRTFDASIRHFWSADQAAIYRALSELEEEGLVRHERISQDTRPDRKVFQVTDTGLRHLDDWLVVPVQPMPRREPLLVKLFFASRLDAFAFRALLQTELARVENELSVFAETVTDLQARAPAVDADQAVMLGPLLTLTNGVGLGIAYRAWLRKLLLKEKRGELTVENLLADLQDTLA